MVEARMALDKDAKHDLYKIALSAAMDGNERLLESELWAEAVFFITAGAHTLRTETFFVMLIISLRRNYHIHTHEWGIFLSVQISRDLPKAGL